MWQVTDGFRAASLVGWRPGWMIGGEGALLFLVLNFGFFLPVTLVALWVAGRERRREELLLLVPALAVFAALFLVKLAPWEWDNTKVMLWCYVAILPAVWDLTLARIGRWPRALLLAALFFSGAVSVVGASMGRGPWLQVLDLAEYDAVCDALAEREDDPGRDRLHLQPPRRAVRAADRGRLRGAPVEPRPRLREPRRRGSRASCGGSRAGARRRGPWARATCSGAHREAAAFPGSSRPWREAGPPVAPGAWGALYRLD